ELLERVRHGVRIRHFSLRTEKAYTGWFARFLKYRGERALEEFGEAEGSAVLTSLAVDGGVSGSTQNQALARLLAKLDGVPKLVASLLYGSGLRLLEGLTLRIKDLDFGRRQLVVRNGKGQKDRVTMLPAGVTRSLEHHLATACERHRLDERSNPP